MPDTADAPSSLTEFFIIYGEGVRDSLWKAALPNPLSYANIASQSDYRRLAAPLSSHSASVPIVRIYPSAAQPRYVTVSQAATAEATTRPSCFLQQNDASTRATSRAGIPAEVSPIESRGTAPGAPRSRGLPDVSAAIVSAPPHLVTEGSGVIARSPVSAALSTTPAVADAVIQHAPATTTKLSFGKWNTASTSPMQLPSSHAIAMSRQDAVPVTSIDAPEHPSSGTQRDEIVQERVDVSHNDHKRAANGTQSAGCSAPGRRRGEKRSRDTMADKITTQPGADDQGEAMASIVKSRMPARRRPARALPPLRPIANRGTRTSCEHSAERQNGDCAANGTHVQQRQHKPREDSESDRTAKQFPIKADTGAIDEAKSTPTNVGGPDRGSGGGTSSQKSVEAADECGEASPSHRLVTEQHSNSTSGPEQSVAVPSSAKVGGGKQREAAPFLRSAEGSRLLEAERPTEANASLSDYAETVGPAVGKDRVTETAEDSAGSTLNDEKAKSTKPGLYPNEQLDPAVRASFSGERTKGSPKVTTTMLRTTGNEGRGVMPVESGSKQVKPLQPVLLGAGTDLVRQAKKPRLQEAPENDETAENSERTSAVELGTPVPKADEEHDLRDDSQKRSEKVTRREIRKKQAAFANSFLPLADGRLRSCVRLAVQAVSILGVSKCGTSTRTALALKQKLRAVCKAGRFSELQRLQRTGADANVEPPASRKPRTTDPTERTENDLPVTAAAAESLTGETELETRSVAAREGVPRAEGLKHREPGSLRRLGERKGTNVGVLPISRNLEAVKKIFARWDTLATLGTNSLPAFAEQSHELFTLRQRLQRTELKSTPLRESEVIDHVVAVNMLSSSILYLTDQARKATLSIRARGSNSADDRALKFAFDALVEITAWLYLLVTHASKRKEKLEDSSASPSEVMKFCDGMLTVMANPRAAGDADVLEGVGGESAKGSVMDGKSVDDCLIVILRQLKGSLRTDIEDSDSRRKKLLDEVKFVNMTFGKIVRWCTIRKASNGHTRPSATAPGAVISRTFPTTRPAEAARHSAGAGERQLPSGEVIDVKGASLTDKRGGESTIGGKVRSSPTMSGRVDPQATPDSTGVQKSTSGAAHGNDPEAAKRSRGMGVSSLRQTETAFPAIPRRGASQELGKGRERAGVVDLIGPPSEKSQQRKQRYQPLSKPVEEESPYWQQLLKRGAAQTKGTRVENVATARTGNEKGANRRRVTFKPTLITERRQANYNREDAKVFFNDGHDVLSPVSNIQRQAVGERAGELSRCTVFAAFSMLNAYVESLKREIEGNSTEPSGELIVPYTFPAMQSIERIRRDSGATSKGVTGQSTRDSTSRTRGGDEARLMDGHYLNDTCTRSGNENYMKRDQSQIARSASRQAHWRSEEAARR